MVHNLGVPQLKEQVTVVASRAFAQLWVVRQLRPPLNQEFLCSLIHPTLGLLQCALCGATLKEHSEATIGAECGGTGSLWGP